MFELPHFFILLGSKTFFGIRKSIKFLISKLTLLHDFEHQITNSILVIRYSIFELPMFFILLVSKTLLSMRKVTEYRVFNIKTFNARF